MKRPKLIVISSPSGGGKTTLCDRLLEEYSDIVYSISCTTREPRGSEVEGEDYFFMTEDGFKKRVEDGLFLESAVVHDCMYGTLKSTVKEVLEAGESVLMDIDTQGARQIREYAHNAPDDDIIKVGYVDVFISPPSIDALRGRLLNRNEDSEEEIEKRITNAEGEIACADEYMYKIINEDLERAYHELIEVIA